MTWIHTQQGSRHAQAQGDWRHSLLWRWQKREALYWGTLKASTGSLAGASEGCKAAIQESSWQLRFYKVRTKKELEAIGRHCDGILAYDVDSPDEVNLFSDLKVPSVLSHHLSRDSAPCVVVTDNYHGGVLQAQFLKKQGCKNPLYITGFIDSVPPTKNVWRFSLLVSQCVTVLETAVGGPDAIDLILDKVKIEEVGGNIDGLSAVNDLTLFELLLKSRSTLPSIGYDASPFYRLFNGPVASIDIQSGEIYRMAALELLSLIEGAESQQKVVLPKLWSSIRLFLVSCCTIRAILISLLDIIGCLILRCLIYNRFLDIGPTQNIAFHQASYRLKQFPFCPTG